MGGMEADSFYNSQLFAFLFAAVIFIMGLILMNITLSPAIKRIEELDSANDN